MCVCGSFDGSASKDCVLWFDMILVVKAVKRAERNLRSCAHIFLEGNGNTRIIDVPVEIRKGRLSNASQKHYSASQLTWNRTVTARWYWLEIVFHWAYPLRSRDLFFLIFPSDLYVSRSASMCSIQTCRRHGSYARCFPVLKRL